MKVYDEAFTPKGNPMEFKEIKKLEEENQRGWLTKAIVNKIKNRKLNKKKAEIEELKLDIEKAKLTKQLKEIKK